VHNNIGRSIWCRHKFNYYELIIPRDVAGFKKSFYVNSNIDTLFGKRKRLSKLITVGVVHGDEERGTAVKGNNGGR
jgi:hypothetical protein